MDYIMGSALREKLIYHFIENPSRAFYLREIADLLNLDPGNLSRELKKLESSGLFKSSKKGRYKVYRINRQHDFFDLLTSLTPQGQKVSSHILPEITHGQAIDGCEIAIICSNWGARRFAVFCNSTIWGCVGKTLLAIPSFTERILVSDDGIDAECIGDIGEEEVSKPNIFLQKGLNVFQYKKRSLIRVNTERKKIVSNLNASLKGSIGSIEKKQKKPVNNYILFTNLDLTHAEKEDLKKSIRHGSKSHKKVECIGSSELATFINNLPHIRSSFFITSSFSNWDEQEQKFRKLQWWGPWFDLVGREDALLKLKSIIQDANTKVIALYGPNGIGKTRLLLEATYQFRHKVTFVTDPKLLVPSQIGKLESSNQDTIVIVDDPDIEVIESLTKEVFARNNLRLIFSLAAPEDISFPAYGFDKRVIPIAVLPLSDSDSEKLLLQTKKPLDFGLMSWIKFHAKGNPGILLAASQSIGNLREKPSNFIDFIGKQFEKKINKTFGERSLLVLKLLSILDYVGISGDFEEEIELISDIFNSGLSVSDLRKQITSLIDAGLVIRKGSFIEVSPPILAIYLAQQLLVGNEGVIPLFLVRLSQGARQRFLKRLSRLNPDIVQNFWREVFGQDGLFRDLDDLRTHIQILHCISGAVPERVAVVLEKIVIPLDVNARKQISGDFRRDLMWALDQLLFRKNTSIIALKIIGLLAEAENETWGNNATGVFCEGFHPLHRQMPTKVAERFLLLQDFAKSESSELKLLVIKAINSALQRTGSVTLRHSDGPVPLDSMPVMTYGEIWDYIDNMCDLMVSLAHDDDPNVSAEAFKDLPHVVAESIIQTRSGINRATNGIEKFRSLRQYLGGDKKVTVTSFSQSLNMICRIFSDDLDKEKVPKDRISEFQGYLNELIKIRESLENSSFELRLKRWAGSWTLEDDDVIRRKQGEEYRFQVELRKIAKEVIDAPEILTDNLLDWLTTSDAQKAHTFFFYLGELDTSQKWLKKLEERAAVKEGSAPFSSYCAGLKIHSFDKIRNRLATLYAKRSIHPLAILFTVSSFEVCRENIEYIVGLINDNLLEPGVVERTLVCGRWIEKLSDDDFLVLLKGIIGQEYQYVSEVMDMMAMWLHLKRSIKGKLAEFAWQCLESADPVGKRTDFYDYDEVASAIVEDDYERGISLAKKLILKEKDNKDFWNPVDRYSQRKFWDKLVSHNRKRSLKMLLDICQKNAEVRFSITWNLKETLNQDKDREYIVELALENERQAEILSECISSHRPGFWEIVIPLADKYLTHAYIMSHIESGIAQMGCVIAGGFHKHYMKCQQMIRDALKEYKMPNKVKYWLEKLEEKYSAEIENERIREENRDVLDYSSVVKAKTQDDPLREWALYKAMQSKNWKDVVNEVNKETILSVLKKYEFSEERRRVILRELGEGY
jgi:DNA-binding MarR family transcriptional regulator